MVSGGNKTNQSIYESIRNAWESNALCYNSRRYRDIMSLLAVSCKEKWSWLISNMLQRVKEKRVATSCCRFYKVVVCFVANRAFVSWDVRWFMSCYLRRRCDGHLRSFIGTECYLFGCQPSLRWLIWGKIQKKIDQWMVLPVYHALQGYPKSGKQ